MYILDSKILIFALLAYALGSISPSYLLAKFIKGINLAEHGSGNFGFTNAMRICGKPVGLTVFFFDLLKGFVPAFFFINFLNAADGIDGQAISKINTQLIFAIAALLGHCFSFMLKFKGGKGILTGAGAFLAILPFPLTIAAVVAVTLIFTTRYVSVGSMSGAILLAICTTIFQFKHGEYIVIIVAWLIAAFACYTHRGNIKRLLDGTENTIDKKYNAAEKG